MAKSKDRDVFPPADQPHRALLIEIKGETDAEDGSATTASKEVFAVPSIEEVILLCEHTSRVSRSWS